jgi:RHH-type proline utilization regulon transcriptional repressor/proline dehydrogenase/delta 1-pyrroline-5-carboxylate dehydrogenase
MIEASPFINFAPPVRMPSALRRKITAAYRQSEARCLTPLIAQATLDPEIRAKVRSTATQLVKGLRAEDSSSGIEGLVQEYSLSSEEGVALMCLAEALLRIPDDASRDALIRDKLADGDWSSHLGGRSVFVNAATWGLVVTGRLVANVDDRGLGGTLIRLVQRAGEPVIRSGIDYAMRMLGQQFVTGETIGQALKRAGVQEKKGFLYSYDMLGEAAMTAEDADRYFAEYETAIHAIGKAAIGKSVYESPGISIKLSALHPRYSRSQLGRVMNELMPRIKRLALLSRSYGIGLNIDAEEADRLELSLDILASLARDHELAGWDGLGFVVQAYGKRCPFVIDWLIDLARRSERRIMVRLVKGAYWDAEIKQAQVDGLADFPVYTRKVHTDVAYIACARRLLAAADAVFPQFATHNAQTLATIYHLAGPDFIIGDYEFQCLHGMGEPLYEQVVGANALNRPCRIYAPVGTHETLLAYLVRRLLENGANSSFVNRIADPEVPVEDLTIDPVEQALAMPDPGTPHDLIALPEHILGCRRNSAGLDLSDETVLLGLSECLEETASEDWRASPIEEAGKKRATVSPADDRDVIGVVTEACPEQAAAAVERACRSTWSAVPVAERAACLTNAADAMQAKMPVLIGLLAREAGKSASNAISEVREAVDFLRYYSAEAERTFGPLQLSLGPVACISPWNFPLAIFTGQIAAALAAGNPVLAKPAEETPLIAAEAVRLLHEAGVHANALQLVPGDGKIGAALAASPDVAGVMFTGSTEVARLIQRQLAGRLAKSGQPIPLIAETGGQNAMIVDSSALTEQVVGDVIESAFDSAGQRCSALRVLCLQEDIADRTLAMLKGAMQQLRIGNTDELSTDVGPVITHEAKARIEAHIEKMRALGRQVEQLELPAETGYGSFVAPTLIELETMADLEEEIFGPVLHVLRYRRDDLEALIEQINASGYGLTFGLHTRLDGMIAAVSQRIEAGNIYVNRNVIGAVVGMQPFGGHGLSGTGPKAGGPLYLGRLTANAPPSIDPTGMEIPLLADFVKWLETHGAFAAAERARAYGDSSIIGHTRQLPGPVGETNLYSLKPRGCVLLQPATIEGLFDQMAAVLATGNSARLEGMELPHDLPAAITALFSQPEATKPAAILVEDTDNAVRDAVRQAAEMDGPIVSVFATGPDKALSCPLECLLVEVVMSINTTAAGGNASLLAIG